MKHIVSDIEILGNSIHNINPLNTQLFEECCKHIPELKTYKYKSYEGENIIQSSFMMLILSDATSSNHNGIEIDIPFVLSKNGRVKIPDAICMFEEINLSLYPGDTFEATLYAGVNVFKDENMAKAFLSSTDPNEFAPYWDQGNFRKEYVPIKTLTNPPNVFKFFDNPISTSCLGGSWASFSIEIKITNKLLDYEAHPNFRKRALTVKSYFMSPSHYKKTFINPIEILQNHYQSNN